MKSLLKISAMALLLTLASCAHHHKKCGGCGDKKQCDAKEGKKECCDKDKQCDMKKGEEKAEEKATEAKK